MKRNRLPIIVVIAGLTVLSSLVWGQVPQMMNYQARLSNSSGEPLDTTIQMVFRIWDDSTGGVEIWVETHTVVVANGGFLVRMGSLTPLSPDVFGQPGRYLGITIGQDQEITPRTELGSVAFTFKAAAAAWAAGSDSAGIAQTVIPGAVTSLEIQDASISFNDIAPNNATQNGEVMMWSAARSGWALGSTVTGITASSGLAGGGTGDVTLSIANDGVTSTMIQDGTVASADLALGAVAQANIADGAVSSGKLNDLAVTSAKLNDLAVTSGKLSDLAVTSGKLSDLAVTGTKIAADAVTDTKIATDAVTDTKIAAAAVTDAKLASMAVTQSKIAVDAVSTDKIAFQTILFEDIAPNNATQNGQVMVWSAARSGWALGSTVTGITASSGLAGGGTGDVTLSIANDGVTSTMIQDGTVASADLALGAVAQANIADGAVSSGKLNDLAVTSGKLSDLAVTSGKLSDLAVTGTKIAADAVTGTKIAADAVTDTKIATDAVTQAKIASMAVTQAKIASDAVSTDKIAFQTILFEDIAPNNATQNGEVMIWSAARSGWVLGSTVTGITASSGLAGGGTGDVTLSIANDGVTSTMIQDGTVASADLALGAVAQANIADGAVSSGKLNDLAVTSGKLSDLAVTSGKLSDLAVTGTKIAADAVTDTKIAAAAVTDTKIAAAAVTDAKIASMAVTQAKIAGNAVSTDKIVNGTILLEDLNNNGAGDGEVLKWSDLQAGWLPSVDEVGSDVWSQTGNVLFTDGEWGIARFGNTLYGLNDSTHVNLGVACTTGTAPFDTKYVTISGGVGNKAVSDGTVIAGGSNNQAGSTGPGGEYATVSGGNGNSAYGQYSVVAGGGNLDPNLGNTAVGDYSVVGGGYANLALSDQATIAGGADNYATGAFATIGGGYVDTANGAYSTVPGGYANSAGADYSFAAGYRARVKPLHVGTFVWSSSGGGFASTAPMQFLIKASNGVGIRVNDPTEDLDVLGTVRLRNMPPGSGQNVVMSGTGVLQKQSSSRRYKKNIRLLEVDPNAYSKLQPVRFRWKEQGTEDIGLIAEDVAEVLPDLVIYDDQGRPDAVKYDLLAVMLLGTIQNQQERIDQLTTQAKTFEQKLSQMQTQINDMLAQYGNLESDTKLGTDEKTGGG